MRGALSFGLVIAVAAAGAQTARADDIKGSEKGAFGVGLILGEPTGICARLYVRDDQAIDAAIGAAFFGGGVQGHADYVFHPFILQNRPSYTLPFYVGPGLRLIDYTDGRANSYFALGLRGVVGLLFDFKTVPLDAFVEVAGVVEDRFASNEGFGLALNLDAGIRYYF